MTKAVLAAKALIDWARLSEVPKKMIIHVQVSQNIKF
jgi:hypothetical protein